MQNVWVYIQWLHIGLSQAEEMTNPFFIWKTESAWQRPQWEQHFQELICSGSLPPANADAFPANRLLKTHGECCSLSQHSLHSCCGASYCRKRGTEQAATPQHPAQPRWGTKLVKACPRCPISSQVREQLGHLPFMPAACSHPSYRAVFCWCPQLRFPRSPHSLRAMHNAERRPAHG